MKIGGEYDGEEHRQTDEESNAASDSAVAPLATHIFVFQRDSTPAHSDREIANPHSSAGDTGFYHSIAATYMK